LDKEPGLLDQISHLLSEIDEAKKNDVEIKAPNITNTSETAVAARASVDRSSEVDSVNSTAQKGEDSLTRSPLRRDRLNVRYIEFDNVDKDVVITDDGVYWFPKRPKDENERKFYRGKHVQYQQHEGATKYHGYLCGPTKDDLSCVTIMDGSTGQLYFNIWPFLVEKDVQMNRDDQGILPKRISEIMAIAKTSGCLKHRFNAEEIFHDYSAESFALPCRPHFLGGEIYLFVC